MTLRRVSSILVMGLVGIILLTASISAPVSVGTVTAQQNNTTATETPSDVGALNTSPPTAASTTVANTVTPTATPTPRFTEMPTPEPTQTRTFSPPPETSTADSPGFTLTTTLMVFIVLLTFRRAST